MIQSPEVQARIAELRQKIHANTITQDELREGISLMRQARGATPQATAGSRAKRVTAKPNGDDLLFELEGL